MFKVELTNKSVYDRTGKKVSCWLSLPATDEEMEEAMNKIGVKRSNEVFISNFKTDLNLGGLRLADIEEESGVDLNRQIRRFENLSDRNKDVVATIIEGGDYSLDEALKIVESQKFTFWGNEEFGCPGDLAFSLFNSGLLGKIDTIIPLEDYIDFDIFGRDLIDNGYLLVGKSGAVWLPMEVEEM